MLKLFEYMNTGFLHHAFWFFANMAIALLFGIMAGDERVTLIGWFLVFLYNAWLIETWLKGTRCNSTD